MLRGALLLYDAGYDDEAKKVLRLFSKNKIFYEALQKLVAEHFNLPEYRIRR